MKRNRLKNISLLELSLVDKGANQHALHVLRKRHEQRTSSLRKMIAKVFGGGEAEAGSEIDDDVETVEKMSDALSVSIADILQKSATEEELDENLTKTLDQFKTSLLKAAAQDEGDEAVTAGDVGDVVPPKPKKKKVTKAVREDIDVGEDTDVLKGLNPAAVAHISALEKRFKDQGKALDVVTKLAEKMAARIEDNDRRAHALTLIGKSANISVEDAVLLLKSAEAAKTGGDEKAVERIETLLKRQAELVNTSDLFKELGGESSGNEGEAGEAEEALNKKAAEIQKANPKISFAKAYRQACTNNPELYEQTLDIAGE